jgi:hypothetical protein
VAISRITVEDWRELLTLTVTFVSRQICSPMVKKYLHDRLVRRDLSEWMPFSDTWFDKDFKAWDKNAKHILSTDPGQSIDLIECAKVIHELEKADPSYALSITLENYSRQKAPRYNAIPLASSVTGAVGLVAHSLMIVCRHHLGKKTTLTNTEVDNLIELLICSMDLHVSNPGEPEYMPYLPLVQLIGNQKNLTTSVQKLHALLTSITQLTIDSASAEKERRQMREFVGKLMD